MSVNALRNFLLIPTLESATEFITLQRRVLAPLPEHLLGIKILCNYSKHAVMCFVEAMDYGNPSWMAHSFLGEFHTPVDREWAERIIENDKIGDPSWVAYYMVRHYGSNVEWAEKIIEADRSESQHNTIHTKLYMLSDLGSSKRSINNVIKQYKDNKKL